MTLENIMVVAPYNMQVNLLKSVLPKGARVGTVDKFQGQESEVVIISMTTSSGEYLPRRIEFLYSKNRLNVAISRARTLAILVVNPSLLSIKCNTIDQIQLVNTLCWARNYSNNSLHIRESNKSIGLQTLTAQTGQVWDCHRLFQSAYCHTQPTCHQHRASNRGYRT